ncbi:hypothetical protein CRX59_11810 [Burkholderia thailandensis]|nr:hypothetical protein CRX59_11810 [Burkholderia thailandensis]PNE80502.1 hypothetical protein A8H34_21210 [Burkholderia thailandensis]PNE86446.1 hypothetical protein A8H30_20865 [Burkholderia thailandensis]
MIAYLLQRTDSTMVIRASRFVVSIKSNRASSWLTLVLIALLMRDWAEQQRTLIDTVLAFSIVLDG